MSGTTFRCQRAKTEVKNASRLRGGKTWKSIFNEINFRFFFQRAPFTSGEVTQRRQRQILIFFAELHTTVALPAIFD